MQQLPAIQEDAVAWRACEAWEDTDLRRVQCYWIFIKMRGYVGTEAGPAWAMQKHRALITAGLGDQRAPGDSKRGLDHLLPPGLGRQQHMTSAARIPSPFGQHFPMDDDLHFAAELMIVFGPFARAWRARQQQAFQRILRALDPIRDALVKLRSDTSKAVAAARDIAGIAFLTAVLRWPDRTQAEGYLYGFKVFGEIENSRIFRAVQPPSLHGSFFGQPAVDAVFDAVNAPPPKEAAEIWKQTQEEVEKGFTEPLVTAEDLNRRFGFGKWRPIHRFIVRQSDGKARLIDDGKRGGQNQWATLEETIYTIGIDTVPAMIKMLIDKTAKLYDGMGLPEWFHLQLGTDDLPDAFRGCPINPAQQSAAVVAVWSPQKHQWMFGVMKGCPYGLGSVVVTFNRYPTLITACLRRVLGLMAAAYFDDNILLDV